MYFHLSMKVWGFLPWNCKRWLFLLPVGLCMLHYLWLNLFLIKKIWKKETQWMARHIQCIREDIVPLCRAPYRIPILYLEISLPVIRGGGKVKSAYHFSEGKKECETSTWSFVLSQQPWAKCTWVLGGTGGYICVTVFILSVFSKNNLSPQSLKI